jgi:hypothetical protein
MIMHDRYLFWTEWGVNPKIERSFLDGSSRFTVAENDLGLPNGLAVDYTGRQIYWTDATRDRIETSDLHGRNRKYIVLEAIHPFGITQVCL